MALAEDEARRLGHDYLGTEHLLLGLLRADDGVGARVLTGLGVTLSQAQAKVVEAVGSAQSQAEVADVAESEEDRSARAASSTPRVMDVLVLAWREARHENWIGCEHILLALLREGEGVAAHVLARSYITEAQVREEITRLRG